MLSHPLLWLPSFTPRRLPGLALWLDAQRSPITLAAGMAADFELATLEYLSRADNASLSLTGAHTIAIWVKSETQVASMGLIGKWDANGNQKGYLLELGGTANRVTYAISADGAANSVALVANTFGDLSAGTLYLIVGTYDGVNATVYVNTTANTTAYSSGVFDNTAAFEIGNYDAAVDHPYDGVAQCAGVWGRGLTAAEVTTLYNGGVPLSYAQLQAAGLGGAASLVSYWELNELSGTRKDLHGSNDLTDNNTVTQAAGTALNAVSAWNDLSGNAKHALQTTQAARPVYRINQQGGRPGLRTDAVDDFLSIANLALNAYHTIFVVGTFTTVAPAIAELGTNPNVSDGQTFYGNNGPFLVRRTVKNAADEASDWFGSAAAIGTVVYDGVISNASSVRGRAYKNGTALTLTDTADTDNPANTVSTLTYYIGSRAGTSVFTDGVWQAIIVYNRALTDSERRKVLRWLSREYGVALTG